MASSVIGALRVVLSADSAAFTSGMKTAGDQVDKLGARLPNLSKAFAGVGLAATAAAAAIVAGLKKTVDQADEMSKAAQKIGMPIDALSKLRYAADLSGVSFESLQSSVGKLSRAMAETAAGGTSTASKAFEALGISVKNSDGTLKSSSMVLDEIATKFNTYSDSASKTALAMAIFGRAGAEMIPLLNGGAASLKAAGDEAQRFGLVLTAEAGKSAEEFNDSLSRIQAVGRGLLTEVIVKLAPTIENVANAFNNAAREGKGYVSVAESISEALRWAIEFSTKFSASLQIMGNMLAGVAEASKRAFTGDFSGAQNALWRMSERVAEIRKQTRAFIDELNASALPGFGKMVGVRAAAMAARPKIDAPGFTEKPETGGGGGGGKADTSAEDELKRQREEIMARLEVVREGLLTEEQTRLEALEKNRATIQEAQALELQNLELTEEQKLAIRQKYADMTAQLEEQNIAKQQAIRDKANTAALRSTAGFLGSMADILKSTGTKNNTIVKALGIAQATMNAFIGASEALKLPFPANIAAFAAVAAKGAAAVAAITAVNPGGGGGGGALASAGGGSAAATPTGGASAQSESASKAVYLTMNGTSFGRDQVRELVEQIAEYSKDGGKVVFAS